MSSNDLISTKLPSASEMARFDKVTINSGVPPIELMERAGSAMFQACKKLANIPDKTYFIFVGPGNNGGDGLVLARLLFEIGAKVTVIAVSSKKYSEENIAQARKISKLGLEVLFYSDSDSEPYIENVKQKKVLLKDILELLNSSSNIICVDALLGIGQTEAPRGVIHDVLNVIFEYANSNQVTSIALDVPTGIDCDTGKIFPVHFKADYTFCVQLLKRGMTQYPAKETCGQIMVLPIGIDSSLPCEYNLLTKHSISLPKARLEDSHKGNFGHVIVIGGCKNMPGAPVLAAKAALRAGAGRVTMVNVHGNSSGHTDPEIMLYNIHSNNGQYSLLNSEQIKSIINNSIVVLGPGIGVGTDTNAFVMDLIEYLANNNIPTVLDADGLNILASDKIGRFQGRLRSFILTPHPGEAGRLLKYGSSAVQEDRFRAASLLAGYYNATVVLKGACSIIYSRQSGDVNTTGNPYMATAGSGDVLSGIIAAFLAQGMSHHEGSCAGVFMHGLSGDIAHKVHSGPIIAGDIISHIPSALGGLNYND
jgi:ADP-dependent NAD(P)H-hydrate dehydratase / NAD(P)H-hydrate epimerase